MADIRALEETREDEGHFETVNAVSQISERLYGLFAAPLVRALTTPQSAEFVRRVHPLRLQDEWLSDRNLFLWPLPFMAEIARNHRAPVRDDNPFLVAERMIAKGIESALDAFRDVRDTLTEGVFQLVYGPCMLGALFPPRPRASVASEPVRVVVAAQDQEFEKGGPLEGILRIIAGAVINRGVFDRRSALILRELQKHSPFASVKMEQVRSIFKQQAKLVRQDQDRAIRGLAKLLPTPQERRLAVNAVRQILMLAPRDIQLERPEVKKLSEALQLDLSELSSSGAQAVA
jgi:hypothetical protein